MTQEERKLRETLELKTPGMGRINYSVKAGAGGGKTTMLSTRVCEQILEGTPIEEFVIITYTNAAAAELREKITDRLRRRIDGGIPDRVQRERAQKALNNIELMQISTIHSFLLKILREYAFESGIVLDSRLLESEEEQTRKEVFFNKWYREKYQEFAPFFDDWNILVKSTGKYADHTREVFYNMFMSMANVREEIKYDVNDNSLLIESVAKKYLYKILFSRKTFLAKYPSEVLKPLTVTTNNTTTTINITVRDLATNVAELIHAIRKTIKELIVKPSRPYAEIAKELSTALVKVKRTQDKRDSVFIKKKNALKTLTYQTYKTRYYSFPAIEYEWNFNKVFNLMDSSPKASRVAEYVSGMKEEYQKNFDAQTRELSNDDILYRANKLLTDNSWICDQLKKRYSKLYVDEFQDTTGLQAQIVKLLAQEINTISYTDTLAKDRLLVVGDPKQSIYRFTGAELSVYEKFDEMMNSAAEDNARSVMLQTNFRSNKDIVDWVNESFEALMGKSKYTKMDTDWDVSNQFALHGVFSYAGADNYDENADVEAVTGLVKNLVGGKYYIEEPDRRSDGSFGTPTLRRIKYSDIMIITKTTFNMSKYVKRFSELGIPVNVQGKFSISSDVVLRNYLQLVDYFADYKNKQKRIAAVQLLGKMDVTNAENDRRSIEKALWTMRRYFRVRKYDPAAIVRYLMSREELFLPKGKEQKKEAVRSFRIKLNQMVESCLMKNKGDLHDLAMLMEKYIEGEVKREIPLESHENAIRLMNVHQSKGLTAQIVIIADRSSGEYCRFTGYKKDGCYYPSATYKEAEQGAPKVRPAYGYDIDLLQNAYKDELEESVRLQYVAATRAAHALIIMPAISDHEPWFSNEAYYKKTPTEVKKWLEDAFEEIDVDEEKETGATENVINLADLARNKDSITDDVSEKMSEKRIFSITPSGMEKAGVTGYIPSNNGYEKEENRPGGNIFGTVMHRVFELVVENYSGIMSAPEDDRAIAVTRIINQAVLEQRENMHKGDNPEAFVSFLKPIVLKYLTLVFEPIIKDAASDGSEPEVYTEYSFSFFVDDSEKADFIEKYGKYLKHTENKGAIPDDARIWVNGQADLVVKQAVGIKVYDYKSDAMNGMPETDFRAKCANKYEGQLALYRYAIGKAFGVAPESVKTELVDLYR